MPDSYVLLLFIRKMNSLQLNSIVKTENNILLSSNYPIGEFRKSYLSPPNKGAIKSNKILKKNKIKNDKKITLSRRIKTSN